MSRCRTFAHARTAQRRGRDRLIRVPRSLFRPQGAVYSSAPRESRLQFAQSSPPPGFSGGGRAGWGAGTVAGRCIAVRSFLAMSSDLMRAMRRSWAWHFVHAISNPKVLRSSSAHGMYFDLLAGLSFSAGAGGGCAGGARTTWLREAAGRRRPYACCCLHREGLSASGSPQVRAARDLQPDR
jgi:hypothetical protein